MRIQSKRKPGRNLIPAGLEKFFPTLFLFEENHLFGRYKTFSLQAEIQDAA